MFTDDDLVREIQSAMRRDVADLAAPANLLPELRKRYSRRMVARRVAVISVPLMVAAAVGVGVMVELGPSGSTVQNAAYVTNQVSKAMDNAGQSIIFITTTETGVGKLSTPGKPATWNSWYRADNTASRTQALVDGRPVWEESNDLNRHTTTTVDHRNRTWTSGPLLVMDGDRTGDLLTPTQIEQAMASGRLSIVDQGEPVDGRPTIHLRGDDLAVGGHPMGFWVDQSTYLPVRAEYQRGGAWDPPFDLTWLPPTPDNLANLTVPIPTGYTQLGVGPK